MSTQKAKAGDKNRKKRSTRGNIRTQAKKDLHELYHYNKMKLVLWTLIIIFAIIFLIFQTGLLDDFYDPPQQFDHLNKLITAFIAVAFVKLALAILHPIYTTYAGKKVFRSYAAAKQSWRLITYIVWIGTIVGVVAYLVGFENLALSLGLISAAFVYVMQTPIMNSMGWLYLAYAKIYRIGDRIQVDDIMGDVVDITLMHTNLREIDGWLNGDILTGRVISVPNKRVFEGGITNYTSQSPYIWDAVKVAITYESNHQKAKKIIEEEMMRVAGKDMKKIPGEIQKMADFPELADRFVTRPTVFLHMSDSSVDMEGIYACRSDIRSFVHSTITENILRRISESDDVNVAYPHIHLVEDPHKRR